MNEYDPRMDSDDEPSNSDSGIRSDRLRLHRMSIYGLYGLYNHDIALQTTDRVTILHGPNGVGKTALLHLLTAALQGKFSEIGKFPFEYFELEFSDNSTLRIHRIQGQDESGRPVFELELRLFRSEIQENMGKIVLDSPQIQERWERLASKVPHISRLSNDLWLDRQFGDDVTADEL